MKKIDFGFNEDDVLNGQWAGIEPYNGEYLDMIGYENTDLLITKVVDSYKGLNGTIDVREIAQDYYADGSYITYANKEKNATCKKIEELLNSNKVQNMLAKGEAPYMILRDAGLPIRMSHLNDVQSKSDTVPAVVTSIKPEIFKQLKDSKKYSFGMSMYNQIQEIKRLREEIAELKESSHKQKK